MRYGNYLPQHLYIRYRIHWNKVINLYEQSAPWPDPKARDKNWSPEKDFNRTLFQGQERDTGQLIIFTCRASVQFSLQYLYYCATQKANI